MSVRGSSVPRPATSGNDGSKRASKAPSKEATHKRRLSLPDVHAFRRRSSRATLFDESETPHLPPTPWELTRRRTGSFRRKKPPPVPKLPSKIFESLPREVFDCILDQLQQLHMGQNQACPSCYLKDLHSLSLTNRAWDRATTSQLYSKVWLLSRDHHKLSIQKILGTSRLKLLRRTLRQRPSLAQMVRELHLSDFQLLYNNATIEKEEIVNLVASLVMACPDLERMVGFHTPYTHYFDRLSYALATRPKLQERVWFLTEDDALYGDVEENEHLQGNYKDVTERFLELNMGHPNMTSLVLHDDASTCTSTRLTFRAIIGTLRQMPALRHLHISGFSQKSFSNFALNALPPDLESLRLENLPGITDCGLLRFSTSYAALSLVSLTLINLEISDLTIIANFLGPHMTRLRRFTLAQYKSPSLPPATPLPLLRSQSLEYIHWELRSEAGPAPSLLTVPSSRISTFEADEPAPCIATSILSYSIRNNLFPSLIRIRVPHDPSGSVQSLCKPLGSALLTTDLSLVASVQHLVQPPLPDLAYPFPNMAIPFSPLQSPTYSIKEFLATAPPSPVDSLTSSRSPSPTISTALCRQDSNDDEKTLISPLEYLNSKTYTSSQFPLLSSLTPIRSRISAQSRILAAQKQPLDTVIIIHDSTGYLAISKPISAFLGDAGSRITYDLKSDRNLATEGLLDKEMSWEIEEEGVWQENVWLTGIGDVMGEWDVVGGKEWGTCGHRIDGRVGENTVTVDDLF